MNPCNPPNSQLCSVTGYNQGNIVPTFYQQSVPMPPQSYFPQMTHYQPYYQQSYWNSSCMSSSTFTNTQTSTSVQSYQSFGDYMTSSQYGTSSGSNLINCSTNAQSRGASQLPVRQFDQRIVEKRGLNTNETSQSSSVESADLSNQILEKMYAIPTQFIEGIASEHLDIAKTSEMPIWDLIDLLFPDLFSKEEVMHMERLKSIKQVIREKIASILRASALFVSKGYGHKLAAVKADPQSGWFV